MGVLAMLNVGGVVLDIWAHNHGRVDQSFFTPWHAVLYGSMAVTGFFLGSIALLNLRLCYDWRRSLPPGYLLSFCGVLLFAIGGVLDLIWHTIFGIEVSTEALLSPTHLILLTAGLLIVSGPLRAAWLVLSPAAARGWGTLGPMLLGAASVVTLLGMFTQFASPMLDTFAAKAPTNLPALTDIFVMNADGSGQTRLTVEPDKSHFAPAWSPDGRKLVFVIWRSDRRTGGLYVAEAGGRLRQLTDNGRVNFDPSWSPDGKRIAFSSQAGKNTQTSEIFLIDADGKNQRQLTSGDTESYHPSWSPNGKRIVFASKRSGRWQLYIMNNTGALQRLLSTDAQASAPEWSHDGTRIAYVASPQDQSQVATIWLASGKTATIGPPGSNSPTWSPNDRWLAFSAPSGSQNDIYRVAASGGQPLNLTRNRAINSQSPRWSPDGRHIAFSGTGHSGQLGAGWKQSFGVAEVIVQTVLLMSIVLLLIHTWALPFGAITLLLSLPSITQLIMADNYWLAIGALATGIIADLIVLALRPPLTGIKFCILAATTPAVYMALYFLTLQLTAGLDWSVNMVAGSILFATACGLFLSFLLDWPVQGAAPE